MVSIHFRQQKLMSGTYRILYCSWYTCQSCYFIVSRPIEDEEFSDSVEDGTALPDAESDNDDD